MKYTSDTTYEKRELDSPSNEPDSFKSPSQPRHCEEPRDEATQAFYHLRRSRLVKIVIFVIVLSSLAAGAVLFLSSHRSSHVTLTSENTRPSRITNEADRINTPVPDAAVPEGTVAEQSTPAMRPPVSALREKLLAVNRSLLALNRADKKLSPEEQALIAQHAVEAQLGSLEKKINDHLAESWRRYRGKIAKFYRTRRPAVIAFTLTPWGVSNYKLEKSSGDLLFDRAIENFIHKEAIPFPRFPQYLQKQNARIGIKKAFIA